MPVILVAYSGLFAGGLLTGASGAGERVRGVVLLDALYGEEDKSPTGSSARITRFLRQRLFEILARPE